MKVETWFSRNVKRLTLGFLILQMSHKYKASFTSNSFARDFFFNIGFPPEASNLLSKIKLKSPPKAMFFLLSSSAFSSSFYRVEKVDNYSDSVLEL